jgi:imidazolonepropionase-like amidohydrolase
MKLSRQLLSILLTAIFAAQAGAEMIIIRGAKMHTLGPAGSVDGGDLVFEDGKILGVNLKIPYSAEARIIEARGKHVTPGFFDSRSQIGLIEVAAVEGTRDGGSGSSGLNAAFRLEDAFNPRSTLIPINRIEGLTRVLLAPTGSEHPIAGQAAVVHLGGFEGAFLKSPAALLIDLGERGARVAGGSRAAAMLRLEEALADARDYKEHGAAYARGQRRHYSLGRLDLEALLPILTGEVPVAVAVDKASDIEAALRLAERQGLRLVIMGGAEAWLVAPALARAGVPVVLDPLSNLPRNFETLGATLENAARLHAAGVLIAFGSGESHNGRNLKQLAGNAVANGLPWEEGLRAITSNPARIWGLADSFGTLEPGMDADLVIWDGDPLEITSFPDAVFIRGVEMSMESRQTRLRDRYMTLDADLPLAYQQP